MSKIILNGTLFITKIIAISNKILYKKNYKIIAFFNHYQYFNIMMNIGKALVLLRKKQEMSQETLAIEARLSRHYIYKLEKNKASPTVSTLEKICEILKVKVSDLIILAENVEKE
ncbi:MAG: helix-turn-helix transcriptional regulator [Spirochaetaceae bacterium]|nr:helix-turn-helix transcriptional regulator [Spirochaetaceae bacterium]